MFRVVVKINGRMKPTVPQETRFGGEGYSDVPMFPTLPITNMDVEFNLFAKQHGLRGPMFHLLN